MKIIKMKEKKKKEYEIRARLCEEDYLYIKRLAEGSKRFPNSSPISMGAVIRQMIYFYRRF